MKNIVLIIITAVFFGSCNNNTNTEKQIKTTENFDWLVNNWVRTNDSDDRITYESWYKNKGNEYLGVGFALKDGDTISKESMKIFKDKNIWRLEISTKEDKYPTYFDVTKIEDTSFACENTENEFPNIIQYWRDGNTLNAIVSNPEFKIEFEFEEIE